MVFIHSWYRFPRRPTQPRPNGGVLDGGLSFERHAVMADTPHDPQLASQELREHEQTFHSFGKLMLFAILHIMVVLSCLALAFLGNAPLLAIILGVGGITILLASFAILG
jgi:Bacterial aa3 type cytochrome c oxidase subunit IV